MSRGQEAGRDEALEEAAKCAENVYGGFTANIRTSEFEQELVRDAYGPWVLNAEIATAIRALKREPNAAAEVQNRPVTAIDGEPECSSSGGTTGPSPAAPDVASMVKRLNDLRVNYAGTLPAEVAGTLTEAAALLAKLGQGWVPVSDEESLGAYLTGIPGKPIYAVDERTQPFSRWRFELPSLPPAPGASDD